MPQMILTAAAGLLVALSACAPRQVESTPPTVTYAFESRSDYDQVAEQAARYCAERYDRQAFLVDRHRVSRGYEAVFACE